MHVATLVFLLVDAQVALRAESASGMVLSTFALVPGFLIAFSGVGFLSPSPVRVGPRPRDHSKTISLIWEKSVK